MISYVNPSIDFDILVKDIHFINKKFIPKSEHPDKKIIKILTGGKNGFERN